MHIIWLCFSIFTACRPQHNFQTFDVVYVCIMYQVKKPKVYY